MIDEDFLRPCVMPWSRAQWAHGPPVDHRHRRSHHRHHPHRPPVSTQAAQLTILWILVLAAVVAIATWLWKNR